ncbi:hypothetical protein [Streptomyces sp. NPDC058466]
MNPGKAVSPYRTDENLRLSPHWRPPGDDTAVEALERCRPGLRCGPG